MSFVLQDFTRIVVNQKNFKFATLYADTAAKILWVIDKIMMYLFFKF